jgi:2-polyprenyl-3-methyl-5-hydroxy-6-metoxy-1,4-benzoquinol methylase
MSFREHPITWDDTKVARLWDYYSRTGPYADLYFARAFGQRMLRLSALPLSQPLDVLDFGCGPGFIWEHLRALDAKWRYTALDFSADSIESLRQRASSNPNFVAAIHTTTLPSSLDSNRFDAVLLFEVLEHLDDTRLDDSLAEVQRVLKPGGRVVVTTPHAEDLTLHTRFCPECGAIYHQWQHVRSWTTTSLAERLLKHGFRPISLRTLDFSAMGVRGLLMNWLRRWFLRRSTTPHMIAVFDKT